MKICNICNLEKDEDEFEKGRKQCKRCRNDIKNGKNKKLKEENIVYYLCRQMAGSAYARVCAPSRSHKKSYRNLTDPFGFKDTVELTNYIYNNFKEHIAKLLSENKRPSLDRIDTHYGYTKNNIRVIDFTENTLLGLETIKRKVQVNFEDNHSIIFNTTSDCVEYFGYTRESSSKVSSWVKKDGKYKLPLNVKNVEYIS